MNHKIPIIVSDVCLCVCFIFEQAISSIFDHIALILVGGIFALYDFSRFSHFTIIYRLYDSF